MTPSITSAPLFITGTDTGVGKTLISCGLLHHFRQRGDAVLGLKPVAAGCENRQGEWRNDDAERVWALSSVEVSYADVNPVALIEPIAPHIAAQRAGINIRAETLAATCADTMTRAFAPTQALPLTQTHGSLPQRQRTIIEGAGGWRVPLNDQQSLADVAVLLNADVILVVGMRLGCLNHALLTAEAIRQDGLSLVGWVANRIDPEMDEYDANLDTLKTRLDAPCLGEVPYLNHHIRDSALVNEYLKGVIT